MENLVSVIMPVMNGLQAGPGYLKLAIDSLVNQDYDGPIEIILIDDGSKDGTVKAAQQWAAEIEQNWQSRRLHVFARPHEGVTRSLNAGIRRAKGKYLARHDADDYSRSDRIRRQVSCLDESAEVGLVGSAIRVVNDTREADEVWYRWKEKFIPLSAFRQGSPLCHGSVMFRRSALKEIGEYDAQYPHAQDYDLFWRLAKRYKIVSIPEPLYCYRVHRNRVTGHPRRFRIQLDCSRRIKHQIVRELARL